MLRPPKYDEGKDEGMSVFEDCQRAKENCFWEYNFTVAGLYHDVERQILSVSFFEKVPINHLLAQTDSRFLEEQSCNQLNLWNL